MMADQVESLSGSSEAEETEFDIWKPARKPAVDSSSSKQLDDGHVSFLKKFQDLRNEQDNARQARIKSNRKRKERRVLLRKEKASKTRLEVESQIEHKRLEEEWQKVKPFMKVYDHIQGPVDHGKYGPKTELEYKIDESLGDGDMGKALRLSDQIANREMGLKISRAFAAKKALEIKLKVDKEKEARKRKRLVWGFEDKERWQMKGNM